MTTRQYLVTVHDVGNITDEARNIHTILTSRDHILPAERVEVVEYRGPLPAPTVENVIEWQIALRDCYVGIEAGEVALARQTPDTES